jgi:hypothetical protein
MPDFLDIIKILVLFGGVVLIAGAAGFALKGLRKKPAVDSDVADRLHGLEGRLAEFEERVDFTERALTDVRARAQIPKQ